MVRLLPLLDRDGPRFREALLPAFRSVGRHARGLRHLRGRVRGAPGGCGDLRPLRRPHRPQVHADRDAAADGSCHLRGGAGADLRADRRLGRRAPHGVALHPGRRCRRRVGRLGADVDGMGALEPFARPRRVVAAVRRAVRAVPRQPRGAGVQRHVRRRVPVVGLARAVPARRSCWSASACGSASASWRRRCSRS